MLCLNRIYLENNPFQSTFHRKHTSEVLGRTDHVPSSQAGTLMHLCPDRYNRSLSNLSYRRTFQRGTLRDRNTPGLGNQLKWYKVKHLAIIGIATTSAMHWKSVNTLKFMHQKVNTEDSQSKMPRCIINKLKCFVLNSLFRNHTKCQFFFCQNKL